MATCVNERCLVGRLESLSRLPAQQLRLMQATLITIFVATGGSRGDTLVRHIGRLSPIISDLTVSFLLFR